MAVDGNETLLPTPPPPRPAARQAAVEAALRKFDGSEEVSESKVRKRPSPGWWSGMNRRPAGALVTAALIAMIGIPTAMIALRDQTIAPRTQEQIPVQPGPTAVTDSAPPPAPVQAEPADQSVAAEPTAPSRPPSSTPLSLSPVAKNASPADELKGFDQASAPMAAPAAPPPPPPAPQVAEEASSQEIVLTGSRVAQPNAQKQRANRERADSAASPLSAIDVNAEFLSRLQSAVRANSKRAIVGLVGLPLRVNFDDGAKTYQDRKSIERDFDLIFTPRVRQAILNQRADGLFTNYQGAMIGDGEVWFDESCANSACSRKGPVRIRAVNP
jgi:hypothetical protein